jgi:hypothetical protein
MSSTITELEILYGLLLLEFHDKNYIEIGLATNPSEMNKVMRELVKCAIEKCKKYDLDREQVKG